MTIRTLFATTLALSLQVVTGTSNAEKGTGANGLKPEHFWDPKIQAELSKATQYPLVAPLSTHAVSPLFSNTRLLSTPAGRDVFDHAVRCGLGRQDYLDYTDSLHSFQFKGGGYLKNTSTWLTQGLTTEARLTLFECMLALLNGVTLNGSTPSVNIGLTGANIAPLGDMSKYRVPEAIWLVDGKGNYSVYPEKQLRASCSGNTARGTPIFDQAFNKRICGTVRRDHCGVRRMSEDEFSSCKRDRDGYWTCFDIPAIETWLAPDQTTFDKLYPECSVTVTKAQ